MVAVSLSSPAQSHSSTAKCIPTKLPRGGMERAAVSMSCLAQSRLRLPRSTGTQLDGGGAMSMLTEAPSAPGQRLTGVSGTFGYVFRENVRDVLNKHNDTHVTRTLDYLSTQC